MIERSASEREDVARAATGERLSRKAETVTAGAPGGGALEAAKAGMEAMVSTAARKALRVLSCMGTFLLEFGPVQCLRCENTGEASRCPRPTPASPGSAA